MAQISSGAQERSDRDNTQYLALLTPIFISLCTLVCTSNTTPVPMYFISSSLLCFCVAEHTVIHSRSSRTRFQLPIIAFNYIQASLVLSSRSIPAAPFQFWLHFFDFASTYSISVIPTHSGLYPLIMNSIHLTSTVHIQTQPSYHSYQPPKSPPTTWEVLLCFHLISPVSRPICLILLSSSLHRRVVYDAPGFMNFS